MKKMLKHLRKRLGFLIDQNQIAVDLGLSKKKQAFIFQGLFDNWTDASLNSTGYDTEEIIDKTLQSALRVKNGQALFERDTVLFDKPDYNWPVLSILFYLSSVDNYSLNLIDFGGSLGSTYFQHLPMLKHLKKIKWNIVEQTKVADLGNKYFKNQNLAFFDDLDRCYQKAKSPVIYISGTIQYLQNPYEFINKIIKIGFEHIIFDRTTFIYSQSDKIFIQKVFPSIYRASYPIWFFNYNKFIKPFSSHYKIMAEFDSYADSSRKINNHHAYWRGIWFKKINI